MSLTSKIREKGMVYEAILSVLDLDKSQEFINSQNEILSRTTPATLPSHLLAPFNKIPGAPAITGMATIYGFYHQIAPQLLDTTIAAKALDGSIKEE